MSPSTRSDTRRAASATTSRAYEAIRESIVSGAYAPGMWLPEPMVASALGLSRTPVREALRMLAAEGSVEIIHNRGARVTAWAPAAIEEVYRLRALLEGHGAALAARHATADDVEAIRALQARYEESVEAGGPARSTAQCNNEFHAAVLRASRSPRLAGLLEVISSTPLVTQALQRYTDDDRRRSVVQHRDIITAVQNGDDALAESAMRSHILAARYSALRLTEPSGSPGSGERDPENSSSG